MSGPPDDEVVVTAYKSKGFDAEFDRLNPNFFKSTFDYNSLTPKYDGTSRPTYNGFNDDVAVLENVIFPLRFLDPDSYKWAGHKLGQLGSFIADVGHYASTHPFSPYDLRPNVDLRPFESSDLSKSITAATTFDYRNPTAVDMLDTSFDVGMMFTPMGASRAPYTFGGGLAAADRGMGLGFEIGAAKNLKQTGSGTFTGSADELYDAIRASDTDVSTIASNTGIKPQNIQKVKDHVFYNEHLLDRYVDYGIPAQRMRFDSDLTQANAWARLENGTHTQADINWLKHETAERWFELKHGSGYSAAHNAAEKRWPGNPWRIQ